MKPLNLIIATLISSFVYFGLMKYLTDQPVNTLTAFVIINFSLMYLAVMIMIILEAAKVQLFEDTNGQE